MGANILKMQIKSEQLNTFIKLLRKNLIASGIDGSEFDSAVKDAVRELNAPLPAEGLFNQHEQDEVESRGVDSLGRILVEYSFIRTPETQMIWPDNSEQDITARRVHTNDCIPRPLMRYFLASIRGSIATLDHFEADSILSEDGNGTLEKHLGHTGELLEDFKGPFGSGESAIDWQTVYSDNRFQQVALELIGDIRRKMAQLGLEQYLRILENYRQRDPDSTGINAMQRPFTIDDAKQIDEALWAAEEALALTVD